MSRENPHITEIVPATLTSKSDYHQVSVILHILELWGDGAERENYLIETEQLTSVTSEPVEPGEYTLAYEYHGKRIRKPVVVTGTGYKYPTAS